eukprot:scaffold39277_cov45-Phaeocystis_antarctica.AAC.1
MAFLRQLLADLATASTLLGVVVLLADEPQLEHRVLPAPAAPPPAAPPPDACANTCRSQSCGFFYGILTCQDLDAIDCGCAGCCVLQLKPPLPPSRPPPPPMPPP